MLGHYPTTKGPQYISLFQVTEETTTIEWKSKVLKTHPPIRLSYILLPKWKPILILLKHLSQCPLTLGLFPARGAQPIKRWKSSNGNLVPDSDESRGHSYFHFRILDTVCTILPILSWFSTSGDLPEWSHDRRRFQCQASLLQISSPAFPEDVNNRISTIIHNVPIPMAPNHLRRTIKSLVWKLKDTDVITTKADKGNSLALIDRSEYNQKTVQCLQSIWHQCGSFFRFWWVHQGSPEGHQRL